MKKIYGNGKILAWLSQNNHTMKWLSEETGIPYSSMKRKINGRTEWRTGEIDRILSVTNATYEELFREDTTA